MPGSASPSSAQNSAAQLEPVAVRRTPGCRRLRRAGRPASADVPRAAARRWRRTSSAHDATLKPNVIGEPGCPCVRPTISVSRCSTASASSVSSIARRSLHTTAPTSRMTRANQVSVTSWTVAPTYTCSRAGSGSTCWSALDQPQHRVRGPPRLARPRGRGRGSARGMRGDLRGRLAGDDAESGLGRGQRGEDVQPALQPGAFLEDLRQLRRAPQVGVLLGVAQAGAHVGSHSATRVVSASEIWASDAPHGTTTRPSSTSMCVSSRQHLVRIGPGCHRTSSAGRCRPAGRARRRTTRGSVATARNRSASSPGARGVRPGSRWSRPRSATPPPRHGRR